MISYLIFKTQTFIFRPFHYFCHFLRVNSLKKKRKKDKEKEFVLSSLSFLFSFFSTWSPTHQTISLLVTFYNSTLFFQHPTLFDSILKAIWRLYVVYFIFAQVIQLLLTYDIYIPLFLFFILRLLLLLLLPCMIIYIFVYIFS